MLRGSGLQSVLPITPLIRASSSVQLRINKNLTLVCNLLHEIRFRHMKYPVVSYDTIGEACDGLLKVIVKILNNELKDKHQFTSSLPVVAIPWGVRTFLSSFIALTPCMYSCRGRLLKWDC